jgi:hypothetical protein
MPPPHSFWVILIGKTPTSFRGKAREDLLPTLRQLQRTQSDVTLRWFERGKVWESPEAAIGAAKLAETTAREKRTREWRPGGEHRDPKARFEMTRDQKRAKFKRDRGEGPPRDERPPRDADRPQSPFGPKPPRAPRPDRPWPDRGKPSARPERGRPDRAKPGGSPFAERGPRPPRGDSRDRPERRDRASGPPGENPFKDRRPDRPDRRPASGRPVRPSRPPRDRGGFKPPKRRS